ncbi:MAG: hypothetical protein IKH30_02075 [Clostridia bacterium]|nr:hypothetical protein [Clostridia bacterium]
MTGFCVREMRKEYRGVTRLYAGSAMLFLVAFACLGLIMRVREADYRLRLLLIGLDIVVVLALLGLHLILTDEKNLIRKTPFGESLRALGDPGDIMRQIDEGAKKRFDLFPSFALLDGWLIVFFSGGWKYEPRRICARPIPRKDIRAAEILPDDQRADSGRMRFRLTLCDGSIFDLYLYQRQELEDLRCWLNEQEQMAI